MANEKNLDYYRVLAKKYHVALEGFKGPDLKTQFKAIENAFRMVNFGEFISGEKNTALLQSQLLQEIAELTTWIMTEYEALFAIWRRQMLKVIILPHLQLMEEGVEKEKFEIGITAFQVPFYEMDPTFFEQARKALVFPEDRLRRRIDPN